MIVRTILNALKKVDCCRSVFDRQIRYALLEAAGELCTKILRGGTNVPNQAVDRHERTLLDCAQRLDNMFTKQSRRREGLRHFELVIRLYLDRTIGMLQYVHPVITQVPRYICYRAELRLVIKLVEKMVDEIRFNCK